MNATAHQEEKNEKTKTAKTKAGKERKQVIDFKEAVCSPSAVVQGAAQQKSEEEYQGKWNPRKGQQPF